MPSLNDAVNPYNATRAITGSEPSTQAGGGQDYFQLTDTPRNMNQQGVNRFTNAIGSPNQPNTALDPSLYDPATGLSKNPYSVQLQRNNQVAGIGQIPGLNYGGTVNGASNLQDIYNQRSGILDKTTQSLNQLESQSGIEDQFTSGLQANGLSRLALMNRLENQFGNGWRGNAQAKQIMDQFDSVLGQGHDLQSLNDLYEQGKTALDFLKSQPTDVTFNIIQKMGDQVVGSSALTTSTDAANLFQLYRPQGAPAGQYNALNQFLQGGRLG